MQEDLTIGALLPPIDPDNPCGEDLRGDDKFSHLFVPQKYRVRQDFSHAGKTVVEEPAWSSFVDPLKEALTRTHDLRLWILQLRVWTGLEGIGGAVRGLKLINGGIERYWQHLHPKPDPMFWRFNFLVSPKKSLFACLGKFSIIR